MTLDIDPDVFHAILTPQLDIVTLRRLRLCNCAMRDACEDTVVKRQRCLRPWRSWCDIVAAAKKEKYDLKSVLIRMQNSVYVRDLLELDSLLEVNARIGWNDLAESRDEWVDCLLTASDEPWDEDELNFVEWAWGVRLIA